MWIFTIIILFRFKDETAGHPILQFCGLRSKCYSMVVAVKEKLCDGNDNENVYTYSQVQKLAAAGVKKCKQKCVPHEVYVEALINQSIKNVTQKTIKSKNHILYTQEMCRSAVSCLDIKRVVLSDGFSTVPYGYF